LLDVVERQWRVRAEDDAATPLKRALKCAQLAENEGAPSPLITAALLHDVAQRDEADPEYALMGGQGDAASEHVLARWFGPEVCEPVRLLPEAKRYLSAVEPGYLDGLPATSQDAVMRGGGPMNGTETTGFEALPFAHDALRLLRWADRAESTQTNSASLAHFLRYAVDCAR